MRRRRSYLRLCRTYRQYPIFLALLLLFAFVRNARADFIYQFSTTTSAGIAGTLSATIIASDAAVASGTISAANITSLFLELSGTSSPFVDETTTSTSVLLAPFFVDTITGAFTTSGPDLSADFPTESVSLPYSKVQINYYVAEPNMTPLQGTGVWTITPEPDTAMLVAMGSIAIFAIRRWNG